MLNLLPSLEGIGDEKSVILVRGSTRNTFVYEIKEKRYEVFITQNVKTHLREAMWDIFKTAFGPGSGANKDFATVQEFNDLLDQEEVFVAYSLNHEEDTLACYAIFSRTEQVISQYAKRDYATLLEATPTKPRKKAIFWVFLFCPNGRRHYGSAHTKALYTAMATFVQERNGVVMFDEDINRPISRFIQKFLHEVGDIKATTTVVQTLQTVQLEFEFPSRKTSNTLKEEPSQLCLDLAYDLTREKK